ncbi:hypothetical protein [Candidatus Sororendozoicomonas aggregata]|uniref:hypothetical protein n=1 Tax=Candidatus Sororendozoicomonas aggregata TaxID=3073239 RepID=UPI002ED24890
MNSMLAAFATLVFMVFITNAGFVHADEKYLVVDFYNKSGYTCKITDYKLKHGYWYGEPKKSLAIKTGYMYSWSAKQSTYGPDMTVTLSCGGYSFSVRNQQNYCFMKGGNQYTNTFNVDKHLNVTNKQTQHAAVWGGKTGIAAVIVSLKKSP